MLPPPSLSLPLPPPPQAESVIEPKIRSTRARSIDESFPGCGAGMDRDGYTPLESGGTPEPRRARVTHSRPLHWIAPFSSRQIQLGRLCMLAPINREAMLEGRQMPSTCELQRLATSLQPSIWTMTQLEAIEPLSKRKVMPIHREATGETC